MKWFFILGRNPALSREEIFAYLLARSRKYNEVFFDGNLLVIETAEGEKFDIQEFGGVLKLGELIFEGEESEFKNFVLGNEIVPADKFTYTVFGNLGFEILKEKFKGSRKKAILKHGRNQMELEGGKKINLSINSDFSIFLYGFEGKIYFGLSNQDYDSLEIRKRDMEKPFRRESLAISPRLGKILVNLSGAKPGDLLLDPFCGVGGILQEGLLKKIKVYGIDKDVEAINGAKENLNWMKKKYGFKESFSLKVGDSRKVDDLQFGAIATETPLGKILRKKPDNNEAKQIIQNFEAFIIPILNRLKKSKRYSSKIAITFPVIRDFHVDVKKISKKVGMKIVFKPIKESRKDQFISRDIVVFV
jgi:tRNA G10  N-methylase Trm11